MLRQRLSAVCLAAALLLAACSGATPTVAVPPTATSAAQPTVAAATAAPTSAPSPTTALPATPAAIGTAATHDLTPADQINPQTQARLRLGYYVADGPNVDLIINNAIATNSGQPQVNVPPNYAAGYLYLPPATYHVAVVPTGQGLSQALAGPMDVTLAAGHRYTLAVIGQMADKSAKGLLVDESDAAQKAGAKPNDSVRIWVNSLAGGTGLDIGNGGGTITTHVDYGAYAASVYPVGNYPYVLKLDGVDAAYPGYDQDFNLPATSNVVALVGTWGTNSDYVAGPATTELNTLEYLQSFSGQTVDGENYNSFSTLLKAIQVAGLGDLLTKQGPHVFMAPNDAAFKRLPAEQLAALMADPKALGDLLRNHIVAGYVPRGGLATTPGGPIARSLTSLLGNTLVIGDGFSINGLDVGGDSIWTADGTQIHPINQLLLPPSMVTPTPAATATAVATAAPTVGITATGRIAYYAGADHSPANSLEIYLINPDGSGKVQVTNNNVSDDLADLSPDGKQIVFVSNRNGGDEIYVMPAPATQADAAAADSQAVQLTHNHASDAQASWTLGPRWSPDGKRIAFVSDHEGNAEIYVMNADGSGQKRLTNNPATDVDPNWSPDGKQIVFDSDRSGNVDVYVMDVDGGGVKDLTSNAAYDGQPVWSPDGKQIAFVSDRAGSNSQVFVMQADGSNPTDLSNSSSNDFAVNWSPDGANLAFFRVEANALYIMRADGSSQTLLTGEGNSPIPTSWAAASLASTAPAGTGHIVYMVGPQNEPDIQMELYIANADGTHPTRLTNNQTSEAEPAISPDGTKIAFDTNRDGNQEIYVMNADGSNPIDLSKNAANDEGPAWSADGKRIAFNSNRDGNGNIYVINADGSNLLQLTTDPSDDGRASWSPDGKQLAFMSDRGGSYHIYVMNADGSGQTDVTPGAANDFFPAWSPDRKHIAFGSDRDGNGDLYVIDADGSNLMRLTTNPADGNLAAWSPDGKQIAFTTGRDGHFEVYLMNADGSGQKRLTTVDSNAWWPSWGQ
jgi:Tol biopolymer transport system component/uncharacterized surface protein with fasciclin (FAS1) repeats